MSAYIAEPVQKILLKDPLIIKINKKAKVLFKTAKINKTNLTLMQCKNIAAEQYKYKNWEDLYKQVQIKLQNQQETTKNIHMIFNNMIKAAISNNIYDIYIHVMEDKIELINSKDNKQIQREHFFTNKAIENLFLNIYKEIKGKEIINIQEFENVCFKRNNILIRANYLPIKNNDYIISINLKESNEIVLNNINYTKHQNTLMGKILSDDSCSIIISGITDVDKVNTLNTVSELLIDINPHKTVCEIVEDIMQEKSVIYDALITDLPNICILGELRTINDIQIFKNAINSHIKVISTVYSHSLVTIKNKIKKILMNKNSKVAYIHQEKKQLICPHCNINLQKKIISTSASYDNIELMKKLMKVIPNTDLNKVILKGEGCSECNKGIIGDVIYSEIDADFIQYKTESIKEIILYNIVQGNIDATNLRSVKYD